MRAFRSLAIASAVALLSTSSIASLVQVQFATAGVSVQSDFAAVLTGAGIAYQQGITGSLTYQNTTTDTNANAGVGQYNGAVDALNFSVGSWFSQALSNIALNGDIRVRNNAGTGNGVSDDIRVQVVCAPAPNNTTRPTCQGSPATGQFNYAFTDANNINWVLDQFTLTLTQNPPLAGEPTILSDDGLPSEAQWEASSWTARQIQLRFNPYGLDAQGNAIPVENASGLITFLAVPEPGSLALAGLALAALAGCGARRRQASPVHA